MMIRSIDIALALRKRGRWIVCDWDSVWRKVEPLRERSRWKRFLAWPPRRRHAEPKES